MHGAGEDIFTANMYLAEDRVSVEFNQMRSGSYLPRYCAGSLSSNAGDHGFCTTDPQLLLSWPSHHVLPSLPR